MISDSTDHAAPDRVDPSRKRDERGDPHPLGAEPLDGPTGERDRHGKGEQIAGGDPLDGAERRVEVAGECVDRHVDDRRVEDRHDAPSTTTTARRLSWGSSPARTPLPELSGCLPNGPPGASGPVRSGVVSEVVMGWIRSRLGRWDHEPVVAVGSRGHARTTCPLLPTVQHAGGGGYSDRGSGPDGQPVGRSSSSTGTRCPRSSPATSSSRHPGPGQTFGPGIFLDAPAEAHHGDHCGHRHHRRHAVQDAANGVREVELEEVRNGGVDQWRSRRPPLGEPGSLGSGPGGWGAHGDEGRGQVGPHLGHQDGAEDGEAQAGGVVADGLGDAGGLAVGEPGGPVDGVGAGGPEHEAHPGPGDDDVPLLGAKLSSVTLPAHRAKPTAARAQPRTTGRLAPPRSSMRPPIWAATTKPMKKYRRKRPASDAVLPRAIWAYSLAKKKTGTKASMAIPSTRFSTRKARIAEDAHLDQRRRGAQLDEAEDDQERDAGGDAQPDAGVAPTPDRRLLEAEHAEADAAGDQRQAPVVHRRRPVGGRRACETAISTRAMTATGTLTQKIARHVHSVR